MKFPRILLVLFLVMAAVLPLAAFDFGLGIYNSSAYSNPGDWFYSQRDSATVWLNTPLGSTLNLYASAIYEFSGTFSDEDPVFGPLGRSFDAGRIEFSGFFPGLLGPSTTLSFRAGRINIQDFSGRVIFGLNDGFYSELAKGNSLFKLSAGYTGLLDKNDALIFIDEDDQAGFFNASQYFASPRIVAGMAYSASELLKGHELGIEVWGQFDVRSDGVVKTNTFYYQPYVSGRIGRMLRWNAWGIYEMGYDGELFSAFAAGGRMRATIPEIMFLRVTASVAWAGGASESLRSYTPIRQSTLASAYSALFTDALIPKLDVGFTPFNSVSANVGGSLFIRSGTVLPLGYDASSTAWIIGGEMAGNISYKFASDMNFSVNSAIFFPNTQNAFPVGSLPRWNVSLGISLDI